MFEPNETNNNALRQYASAVANAALQGRVSSTEITPPHLTSTSIHTPDTEDGRVREEAGKLQLLRAVALLPVTQVEDLITSLKITASLLIQICEIIHLRQGHLEEFLDKYETTVKNFVELGVDTVVALWLHWNNINLKPAMLIGPHQPAATGKMRATTASMLEYLEHVRDIRPARFEQNHRKKIIGFTSDLRTAANENFHMDLLRIPRFLHLAEEYDVYSLNLPNFDNIRIEKPDKTTIKVLPPPFQPPKDEATPFDPSAQMHNISVGYASGQNMTPWSPLHHGMPQPHHAPTTQYHAPTPNTQHAQPTYQAPPQHMRPPQPMQPTHPYQVPHPPVAPGPIARFPQNPKFPELDQSFDDYLAEIKRSSDENRARASASPIPTISFDATEGRYRAVTPDVGTRRYDHGYDITRAPRRAVSHQHLSAQSATFGLDDRHSDRVSRRRSERLSPHDVPRDYDAEGKRSRRASTGHVKSERRPSRRNSQDTDEEEEEDRTRSKKKENSTKRSKSHQGYDSESEEEVTTKKKSTRSKSHSRLRTYDSDSEDEAAKSARRKEKRKSNRTDGSRYYS